MKNIFCIGFCIFLLSDCRDKEESCTPSFFRHYKENQLCGLIRITPELLKTRDSVSCSYRIIFPFWEEVDRVDNPRFVFNGYLTSVGNMVYYSLEDDTASNKIFDFSTTIKPDHKDTSLLFLKINDVAKQHKIMLDAIDYHRPLKSMIFKYKLMGISLLNPNDNLTILVSPNHGIIGAYVSFINSGSILNGKEYVVTYIGDIMPFSLFRSGAIFEKFQGYE